MEERLGCLLDVFLWIVARGWLSSPLPWLLYKTEECVCLFACVCVCVCLARSEGRVLLEVAVSYFTARLALCVHFNHSLSGNDGTLLRMKMLEAQHNTGHTLFNSSDYVFQYISVIWLSECPLLKMRHLCNMLIIRLMPFSFSLHHSV